jgi:calcium-translocating P-type ATPase
MTTSDPPIDRPWHTLPAEEAVRDLDSDIDRGLPADEAERRRARYGPNTIREAEQESLWRVLLHQFVDPLIYILLAAAAVSLAFDEAVDAAVILAVVGLNAAIGFSQERRARRAIEGLQQMTAPKAQVVRDGREVEIAGDEVVPGDIVRLSAGGRVPADVRIVQTVDLRIDESALTGESVPVVKDPRAIDDERAVPGDQLGLAFAGTTVVRGRGRGVVVRTGDASELGRIAEATHAVGTVRTPLQEKMNALARTIGVAVAVLAALVVAVGTALGTPLEAITRTAVALAVGAVPEALPIVLTVTLAVGVQRMASRNAIIRSLPAVETLGSTTAVGSDKTGTLTANRMTVRTVWALGERHTPDDAAALRAALGAEPQGAAAMTLLAGLLANEADRVPDEDDPGSGGDPTEIALLAAAVAAGHDLDDTRSQHRELDVIPFESERQYMASLNDTPTGRRVFVKGAPEVVLARCQGAHGRTGERVALDAEAVRAAAAELADEGQRVLAMAYRDARAEAFDGDDVGDGLIFLGLQGIEDPVRPEAVDAVAHARRAGIRVLMLTGDHVRTARAVARQLGLGGGEVRAAEGRDLDDLSEEAVAELVREVDVYARVSPQHKLRLVESLKGQGHIVAVTGDGVNDAPALRAAHIGVAMGRAGTDVAREASQMVLADDNFASITSAIEEGRVVFANVRKVTYFLLSTGVGLVVTILSSLFGAWPLPYVAAQVLWINLVTNGLQDVALAFERGEPGQLDDPPRDPEEGVLNAFILWRLALIGGIIAAGTMATFWWMLRQGAPLEVARSVAMTQMVVFQFFHVLNARSFERSLVSVPLAHNRFLFVAMGLAVAAHLAALYLPFMQAIFDTVPLTLEQWGVVLAVGATVVVAAEIDKALIRRRRERERPERRRESA